MSLCVHGVQIRLPGLGKVGPVGHHVARQLSLLLSVPTATSMQIFFNSIQIFLPHVCPHTCWLVTQRVPEHVGDLVPVHDAGPRRPGRAGSAVAEVVEEYSAAR